MADFTGAKLSFINTDGYYALPAIKKSGTTNLTTRITPSTTYFKMLARNLSNTSFVSWVVSTTPDTNGTYAPEAVNTSTITIAAKWVI